MALRVDRTTVQLPAEDGLQLGLGLGRGDRLVVFAINETADEWHIETEVVRQRLDGDRYAVEPVRLVVPAGGRAAQRIGAPVATADDPTNEVLTVGDALERAWWGSTSTGTCRCRGPHWTGHGGPGRIPDELVLTVVADRVVRELTIYPERIRPDATIDRQLVDLLPGEPTELRARGLGADAVAALLHPPMCWHAARLTGSTD
jgi:beta-mannosidase